jgi:hypothetical protein
MPSFQVHFFVRLPGTASMYSAGNISNSNMLLLAETHSSKLKTAHCNPHLKISYLQIRYQPPNNLTSLNACALIEKDAVIANSI